MDNDSQEQHAKSSRARERQQKRRERQQHVRSTGTTRQIRPPGEFKPPSFKLPNNRSLLYFASGAIFLVGMIFLLGLFKNNAPQVDPNALWLGTEWTYEARSSDALVSLAARLRQNRIGTIYAWVSWLKTDGLWAGKRSGTNEFSEVKAQVIDFVKQLKLIYPEVKLYAWVSVPTNTLGIPARLGESTVQQAITDFSRAAIDELGFDGIALNVELIWDGDQDFLEILRRLRGGLPANVPVSVAVPPDWSPLDVDIPKPPLIAPGTVWSKAYKQNVALLADQIAVMAYNSGLGSPEDYAEWVAYQVKVYADALRELGTGTQLLIGIPTYEAELPAHDPAVENVVSAVQGVRLALEQDRSLAAIVQGLAIYAEWETDSSEWNDFTNFWVNPSR